MSIVVHKRFIDNKVQDATYNYTMAEEERQAQLYEQLSDVPSLRGFVQAGVSVRRQWDAKQSNWVKGECLWIAAMGDFDESTLVLPDTVTVQVNLFKHDDNHRLAAPQAK